MPGLLERIPPELTNILLQYCNADALVIMFDYSDEYRKLIINKFNTLPSLMNSAVKMGNLSLLDELVAAGFQYDKESFMIAVEFDQIETLKFLIRCDKLFDVSIFQEKLVIKLQEYATRNGKLKALSVIFKHSFIWSDNLYPILVAAMSDIQNKSKMTDLQAIMDWLLTKSTYLMWNNRWWSAARYGDLDILEKGFKYHGSKPHLLNQLLYHYAIEAGYLDIVKWLYENKCPINRMAPHTAINNDRLEILEYLHKIRCPFDCGIFESIILHGKLKYVQWLHEHGYSHKVYIRRYVNPPGPEMQLYLENNDLIYTNSPFF